MAAEANQDKVQNADSGAPASPRFQWFREDTSALAATAAALMLFTLTGADVRLWPAAILAPLPLLVIAAEVPGKRAAQFAFGAHLFGNFPRWPAEMTVMSLPILIGIHAAEAALFAATVVLAGRGTRRWAGWLATLVYPVLTTAAWFGIDKLSPNGTYANPAYGVVDLLPLMQIAAYTGLAGITFLISLVPAALAVAWYRRRWRMKWQPIAALPLGIFAIAVAAGAVRMITAAGSAAVKVGVAATDRMPTLFDAQQAADAAKALGLYAPLVTQAASEGAQVVVLPEEVVGAAPQFESRITAGFAQMAMFSHVWLVVGINENGRDPQRNVAFVFSPEGKIVARYEKRHLIPGVESRFAPGTASVVFDSPWGRSALAICKDLDFPALGREIAAQGATIVLAPAWDWQGTEVIHQRMAKALGIASGLSIARAARQGIVSLTDSAGRTVGAASTFEHDPALLVAELPIGAGATFYARHGDWFGWTAAVLAAIILGLFALLASADRARAARRAGSGITEEVLAAAVLPHATEAEPEHQSEEPEILHYRR
ncbi:MAG TPA: nitrilase-related carbon-nitrogen hydrolase [Candidatus Binataceae bacterium]|nr:nitrilase-related carbon-nitrogen hydrolase [Candidatus Binataceae bacterium]